MNTLPAMSLNVRLRWNALTEVIVRSYCYTSLSEFIVRLYVFCWDEQVVCNVMMQEGSNCLWVAGARLLCLSMTTKPNARHTFIARPRGPGLTTVGRAS